MMRKELTAERQLDLEVRMHTPCLTARSDVRFVQSLHKLPASRLGLLSLASFRIELRSTFAAYCINFWRAGTAGAPASFMRDVIAP